MTVQSANRAIGAAARLSQNHLLMALPSGDFAALVPHLERIQLEAGGRIASSASPLMRVCFPETAVATFGEMVGDSTRFEVGMIGREGMIGWPVLLGAAHSPHSGIVQLGGSALVMPARVLTDLCTERRGLHIALLQFVQSFTVQLGQTVVANLRDGVERRLARWLLMLHDRIDGDLIAITHGALAETLCVRRASVTDALHILEGERTLRCTRGLIQVRDRAALESMAGPAYGPAETSYRGLIAPFGKIVRSS